MTDGETGGVGWLSEEEVTNALEWVLMCTGRPCPEDQLFEAVQWINLAMVNGTVAEMVLKRTVKMSLREDGKIMLSMPSATKGKE